MKVESLSLPNLQNAEHFEFMTNVNELIIQFQPENIDIAAQYPIFKAAYEDEDKSFKILVKSSYTKSVEQYDAERDQVFAGVRAHVKNFQNYFDKSIADAAYRLRVLIDSYGNLAPESYDRETAGIYNLLQDLRSEKYAADVESLKLELWIEQLDASNKAFEQVMKERYSEQSERDSYTRLRTARRATDVAYTTIRERINAAIVFNGEEKYSDFVLELNARINRFATTLAQRKGKADATKN